MWITSEDAMNGQAPASGRPTQNSSGSASSAARKWNSAEPRARRARSCGRGVRQQAARGALEEVSQRRRREVRLLREVVPLAQQHRVARARLLEEAGRLLGFE